MAGVGLFRVGLKVLIPTRCLARNQASRRILFRSIYICYERSSSWILSLVAPRTPPLSPDDLTLLSRCVFLHRVRYRIRYRACGCRLPLILPMSLNDNSHQRTKRTRSSSLILEGGSAPLDGVAAAVAAPRKCVGCLADVARHR